MILPLVVKVKKTMETYGCDPNFRSKNCSFVLPGIWVPQTDQHTQVQFLTGADCVISYSI